MFINFKIEVDQFRDRTECMCPKCSLYVASLLPGMFRSKSRCQINIIEILPWITTTLSSESSVHISYFLLKEIVVPALAGGLTYWAWWHGRTQVHAYTSPVSRGAAGFVGPFSTLTRGPLQSILIIVLCLSAVPGIALPTFQRRRTAAVERRCMVVGRRPQHAKTFAFSLWQGTPPPERRPDWDNHDNVW
jgi:hypothetical protein